MLNRRLTPEQVQRVTDHEWLVKLVVRKYVRRCPWTKNMTDDLMQEGRLGLAEAASRRDPDLARTTKWSSYAQTYVERWVWEFARKTQNPASTPGQSGRVGWLVVARGEMPENDRLGSEELSAHHADAEAVRRRMIQRLEQDRAEVQARANTAPAYRYSSEQAVDLYLRVTLKEEIVERVAKGMGVSRPTGDKAFASAARAFEAVRDEIRAEGAAA